MKSIKIYFSDLNSEKQQELKQNGYYHENIDLAPLAILELESTDPVDSPQPAEPELYLLRENKFERTSSAALESIYNSYSYDAAGFKDFVLYYEKDKNGHMIARHYKCTTANSADGCVYCACGFKHCKVCGSDDFDDGGAVILAGRCPGVQAPNCTESPELSG